jgi:hypothetical protein
MTIQLGKGKNTMDGKYTKYTMTTAMNKYDDDELKGNWKIKPDISYHNEQTQHTAKGNHKEKNNGWKKHTRMIRW